MKEFDLISRHFVPLAAHPAALGLKDDAALLDVPPGQSLVVTKDAIAQGVHFIGDEPPALIARKLLRVNLSDLAAMGASPLGYFLALMLPTGTQEPWVADFAQGLAEDQAAFGLSLLGGDTIAAPGPLTLSLTALGTVPAGRAICRSGAQPGDIIAVSGTIGDAALGLHLWQGKSAPPLSPAHDAWLKERYRLPQPRLSLGQALHGLVSAGMDCSDGLLQDIGHIAKVSSCAAEVDAASVPCSPAARAWREAMPEIEPALLTGGDDYELIVTFPPEREETVMGAARACHVGLTAIGRITRGEGVTLYDASGAALDLPVRGFEHFRQE